MNTTTKTLAFAVAMSIALLACNDTGFNSTEQDSLDGNNSGINAACKQGSILKRSFTDSYLDTYYPDLDPACKSEGRELFSVSDLQEIVFEVDGEYYSNRDEDWSEICAKGIYFNGEYVSPSKLEQITRDNTADPEFKESLRDEYDAYLERKKRCAESMASKARDIAIPCELIDRYALLTKEDIAKLEETYDDILIWLVRGANGEDDPFLGGGGDLPVPCDGGFQ